MRFVLPIVLAMALLWWWAEGGIGPSSTGVVPHFVEGQLQSEAAQIDGSLFVDPFREGLAPIVARFIDWTRFLSLFFGPLGLLACAVALGSALLFRRGEGNRVRSVAIWSLAIILLLTIVRFRIVDRYVLLLLPCLAVVIGAAVEKCAARYSARVGQLMLIVLLLSSVFGVATLSENARVAPQSAQARSRLIGSFTLGVPLTVSAVNWLNAHTTDATEIYAHGALYPAARVEFARYPTVRSVLWPLRFLNQPEDNTERILLWQRSDSRRLERLLQQLRLGGYELREMAAEGGEIDSRLSIFRIQRQSQ